MIHFKSVYCNVFEITRRKTLTTTYLLSDSNSISCLCYSGQYSMRPDLPLALELAQWMPSLLECVPQLSVPIDIRHVRHSAATRVKMRQILARSLCRHTFGIHSSVCCAARRCVLLWFCEVCRYYLLVYVDAFSTCLGLDIFQSVTLYSIGLLF